MDRLGCDSVACVLQGKSSHAGRMKTTSRGLGDAIAQAIACRTDFCMSFGSHSGLAMHDPVSLELKDSKWAPKLASSGNAVQYSTFGFMELLSGLANISKVVSKHVCIAEAS